MANVNWWTVGLLVLSNLIMLYAWYGHLKSMGNAPLWMVILVSWSIALLTFVPFSIVIMKQPVSWNYMAAAVCIFGAVYFIFRG